RYRLARRFPSTRQQAANRRTTSSSEDSKGERRSAALTPKATRFGALPAAVPSHRVASTSASTRAAGSAHFPCSPSSMVRWVGMVQHREGGSAQPELAGPGEPGRGADCLVVRGRCGRVSESHLGRSQKGPEPGTTHVSLVSLIQSWQLWQCRAQDGYHFTV